MLICCFLTALLSAATGCRTPPPAPRPPARPPVRITSLATNSPRPLAIHVITVDLSHPGVEVVCAAMPDPDGRGPAETGLVTPTVLFTNAALSAAVNANAFAVVEPPNAGSAAMYVERAPATFCGLAASAGRLLSQPEPRFPSFWVDAKGVPHIGTPADVRAVREGVAGFNRLLREGKLVTQPSDRVLHPRTAVGFSTDRRTLWLVVVDGREPGVSEGMGIHELALFMRQLGAWEALNLDGGGSSVMLYTPNAERQQVARIINRPSTRFLGQPVLRPVPNLLGVRVHKHALP